MHIDDKSPPSIDVRAIARPGHSLPEDRSPLLNAAHLFAHALTIVHKAYFPELTAAKVGKAGTNINYTIINDSGTCPATKEEWEKVVRLFESVLHKQIVYSSKFSSSQDQIWNNALDDATNALKGRAGLHRQLTRSLLHTPKFAAEFGIQEAAANYANRILNRWFEPDGGILSRGALSSHSINTYAIDRETRAVFGDATIAEELVEKNKHKSWFKGSLYEVWRHALADYAMTALAYKWDSPPKIIKEREITRDDHNAANASAVEDWINTLPPLLYPSDTKMHALLENTPENKDRRAPIINTIAAALRCTENEKFKNNPPKNKEKPTSSKVGKLVREVFIDTSSSYHKRAALSAIKQVLAEHLDDKISYQRRDLLEKNITTAIDTIYSVSCSPKIEPVYKVQSLTERGQFYDWDEEAA